MKRCYQIQIKDMRLAVMETIRHVNVIEKK